MSEIIVLAHNIRSTHNIGSIFRTADGFGAKQIIISGYSPYPATVGDPRLPHIRNKITRDIHKTALGAETTVPFHYAQDIIETCRQLKSQGYRIIGLEQDQRSVMLPDYTPAQKVALLIGEEVHGIEPELRDLCDDLVEIPMHGTKESFNVSVATGIMLYHLCYP